MWDVQLFELNYDGAEAKAVQEVLTSSKGLMGVFIDGQVVDCSVVVLCQRPDSIRAAPRTAATFESHRKRGT